MAQPTIIDNVYTLRKKIGQGGFASVYAAEVDLERFNYTLLYAYTQVQADSHGQRRKMAEELAAKLEAKKLDTTTMRSILEAHDIPLPGNRVAIKIGSAQTHRGRFEAEWKNLLCLRHENVIEVYGGGIYGKRPYYAMELLQGIIPTSRISKKFTVRQKLEIIRQAGEGLQYLHNNGIVHRDIKPDNLLTCKSRANTFVTKITDLGIAKEMDDTLELTQDTSTMGTPHYMSPEQLKSAKNVDHRSDIYSLGASLYVFITGRKPYHDKTSIYDIIAAIKDGDYPSPPRKYVPQIPEALENIITCAMQPNLNRRYVSVEEMARDLEQYLTSEDPVLLEQESFPPIARAKSAAGTDLGIYTFSKARKRKRTGTHPEVHLKKGTKAKTRSHERIVARERARFKSRLIAGGIGLGFFVILALSLKFFIGQNQHSVDDLDSAAATTLPATSSAHAHISMPLTPMEVQDLLKEKNKEYTGKASFNFEDGKIVGVNLAGCKVKDISALQNLPLVSLNLSGNPVTDLVPIAGSNITTLVLARTRVRDITPLQGLPLEHLDLHHTQVKNLDPIRSMPLTSLNIQHTQVDDLWPLERLSLKQLWFSPTKIKHGIQVLAHIPSLTKVHPDNGKPISPKQFLAALTSKSKHVPHRKSKPKPCPNPKSKPHPKLQASPRGMTPAQLRDALRKLNPKYDGRGRIDAAGNKIIAFDANKCGIMILNPLRGLPIKYLCLSNNPITGIGPLRNMPLIGLNLHATKINSLEPLRNMQHLLDLEIAFTRVKDLEPLRGMRLTSLSIANTRVTDLSPLRGMPLQELYLQNTPVTDITPLEKCPLRKIVFTPKRITRGLQVLRRISTLKSINNKPAAKFWQKK